MPNETKKMPAAGPVNPAGYYDSGNPGDGLLGPFDHAIAAMAAAVQAGLDESVVCVFRWSDHDRVIEQFDL